MAVVLIAGCGYVGSVLGAELAAQGHDVHGLRRDPTGLPAGVKPLAADLLTLETLGVIPEGVDFVVFAAAPSSSRAGDPERTKAAYRAIYLDGFGNLLRTLTEQAESPRRVFFTSSTSVYGQRRGEWVNESAAAEPARFNGEMMLMAEGMLRGSRYLGTSLRFGGIYGPGRTRLIDSVRSGEARVRPGGPHYTNRIHRDDAAGILAHLIGQESLEELYLGVDSDPAEEAEVYEWLAKELGTAAPQEDPSATALARGVGSKRCSNAKLLGTGYRFRYPTFREGYGALIREDSER